MICTCSVNESLVLNHARSISKSLFASHLWPLDLHGPPPRRTTFMAFHEVQVLKKPSSSIDIGPTPPLDALDLWSQQKHQYHKLAPVVQDLLAAPAADFLHLWASDSGTPE